MPMLVLEWFGMGESCHLGRLTGLMTAHFSQVNNQRRHVTRKALTTELGMDSYRADPRRQCL